MTFAPTHLRSHFRAVAARAPRAVALATLVASLAGCSLALDWDVSHLPPGNDARTDTTLDSARDEVAPVDTGDDDVTADTDTGFDAGTDADTDVVADASDDADAAPTCDADLTNDPRHCGRCEVSCLGTTCVAGVCTATCEPGRLDCDTSAANGCETNGSTDNNHCGSCSMSCTGGRICCDGGCFRTCQ